MSRAALRVAGYRFRATFGGRWGGYLALVLLIGLVGGLALGAVAAARRTQAAFPAYLASTNPSDLTVLTGLSGPGSGYDPAVIRKIAALPHVRRVESYAGLNVAILAPGAPPGAVSQGLPGSVDGEFFNQDRLAIVQGRMANPDRPDEIVIDAKGTPPSVHVGEVIPLGFYTNAQVTSPDFGRPGIRPYLRINVKVVGKAIFSREVVQDDADTGLNGGALFTPALTRRLAACCSKFTESAIQLDGGASQVAAAEAGIERVLPKGFPVEFYVTSLTEAKAERAIKPESIALAVFGGIAGLAALVIAGQVVAVQRPAEIVNYRSMGATPALLGAALAAGAVAALALTLFASVRRRRRDLALLKTIGFTRRQLAAAVAWQSTIAVALGAVVGVPLGIALGRFLWDLFAREISVVPEPAVPGPAVFLIAVGALVLANVVAAVPGRIAGRTPTALLLRTE